MIKNEFLNLLEKALGSKDNEEINPSITPKDIKVDEKNWKQYFATLYDGAKIYYIDGEYVRKKYLVDFTMGGHYYVYPKFIPKNEVWVEKMIHKEDEIADLMHEVIERILMSPPNNNDYKIAHEKATNIEEIMRKHAN